MGFIDSMKGRWSHRTGFRLQSPLRETKKFARRYLDDAWALTDYETVRKMLAEYTDGVIQAGLKKKLLLKVDEFVDAFIKRIEPIFEAQEGTTAFLKKRIVDIHDRKDKIDRILKNMKQDKRSNIESELTSQWSKVFGVLQNSVNKNIKLSKDLAFSRHQMITMNWGFDLEQKRRLGFFYQREKEFKKEGKTDLNKIEKATNLLTKHPNKSQVSEDFKIYLEHIQKEMTLFNMEVKDLVTLLIEIEKVEARVINEFINKLVALTLPPEYVEQIKTKFSKINKYITDEEKVQWQADKSDLAQAQA